MARNRGPMTRERGKVRDDGGNEQGAMAWSVRRRSQRAGGRGTYKLFEGGALVVLGLEREASKITTARGLPDVKPGL